MIITACVVKFVDGVPADKADAVAALVVSFLVFLSLSPLVKGLICTWTELKSITRVKATTATAREPIDVEKRRKWRRFGQAAMEEDQSNQSKVIVSRDDICVEDSKADADEQEEIPTSDAFWAKQQRRQLEQKYDVEDTDVEAIGAAGSFSAADVPVLVQA